MPTLHWIGKEKVINHHLDVPYKVLDYKYTYQSGGNTDNKQSENKIIHGDNLEALKSLLPQYEGRIDCIYIDPPYNTGNESWVYNDNVNDPKIKKWLGEVVGKEGEDLSRHDKWLCMMYPRLKLLQRLLSDTGAIFISIDDNEQANLKLLCDEIFGAGNFVANLVWRSADASNNDAKQFSSDYNHTLIYSKKPNWEPERFARTIENNMHYKNPDNDPNGAWFSGNVSSPNPRPNLRYSIATPSGKEIESPVNGWRWSEERMLKMIDSGEVVFAEDETRIIKKTYLKDQKGIVPSNIWWDIDVTGHNRNAKYELLKIFSEKHSSKVFKTPKPTKFIERILQLFSKKTNAIILDSFAGSGTTAHAVLNLNKEDGGNRKFILIEMEDYAETITAERVRRVIDGYGNTEGTGGNFTYYELGQPLLIDNKYINEDVPLEILREYIFFTETRQVMPTFPDSAHPYLLGSYHMTDYYFYYEKNRVTTLDNSFLSTITQSAENYLIYADICTISDSELLKHSITFKKIPRDITRL